jgi:K+-sensing histidine kinase KdpD
MGTITRLRRHEPPSTSQPHTSGPSTSIRIGSINLSTELLIAVTALLAPIMVAAALIPWRSSLDTADGALILVVVIVAVASSGCRGAAALSAVSSALSFDYFLTRPYSSLRIERHADLVTEILLLVVGLAVGELAARGRSHRQAAFVGRSHMKMLHSITELTASGQEPSVLEARAVTELEQLLSLRSCRFTRERSHGSVAQVKPDGSVVVGVKPWATTEMGLPTRRVDLPVRGGGWLFGHFELEPTPGRPVPAEALVVAVAVADQVGAALAADAPGPRSGTSEEEP